MTNRIYSNGGRRAAPRRRPAPGRSAAPPAQQRRLVQLVICGSLFVLLERSRSRTLSRRPIRQSLPRAGMRRPPQPATQRI